MKQPPPLKHELTRAAYYRLVSMLLAIEREEEKEAAAAGELLVFDLIKIDRLLTNKQDWNYENA